jgi:hypothetical protein
MHYFGCAEAMVSDQGVRWDLSGGSFNRARPDANEIDADQNPPYEWSTG